MAQYYNIFNRIYEEIYQTLKNRYFISTFNNIRLHNIKSSYGDIIYTKKYRSQITIMRFNKKVVEISLFLKCYQLML